MRYTKIQRRASVYVYVHIYIFVCCATWSHASICASAREWVLSHVWMSHISHVKESCQTFAGVMSRTWVDPVTNPDREWLEGLLVVYTYIYMHIYIYTYVYMYVYILIYFICVCVHIYVYIYIYAYIHIFTCIHMHIYRCI